MKLFSKMISDRNKKGFTLVEMLIVIAVLVILMAVAVPNAAGYVKRIKLMELDDSARSIFMAVQNKMTVMKQAGESLAPAESKTYAGNIYPEIFNPAPAPDPAAPVPDGTDYLESEPRYLINSKSTSNAFVELSTIEGQLYNHNYVIEYDATTGRVFGVFYSEDVDLTQNPNKYPDDYTTLESRDFETRLHADKLVGYYGGEGDLMKVPTGGENEQPTNIADSTLEKLVFMLDPPFKEGSTTEYDNGRYYFEVTITGEDANGQEHTIAIVPYDTNNLANNYYVEGGKRGTVILDSIAPGCGADNGQWYLPSHYNPSNHDMSGYTLERDFKGWVYINEAHRDNFFTNNCNDNPDMKNSYNPYIHSVSDWNLGKNYITADHPNAWEYARYFRIDPGSDIKVTVTRYDAYGTKLSSPRDGETFSSYFKEPLNGSKSAKIAAGRHLQNLANYVNKDLLSGCSLETDIDFSQDTGNYDSWNSAVTYKGTEAYPYLYNFKPVFSQFVDASVFKDFHGNNHVIKYIRIDTANDPRYKDDASVKDSTSFFVKMNNGNINGIKFYCPVVIGSGEYTGMLFGQCTGGTEITNVEVANPIIESSGKYVGGLFGEIGGGAPISGHKVYVEEVENHFDNYTYDFRNRKDPDNIRWGNPQNDPYARFCIKGTGENTYAGGMVGHTLCQLTASAAAIRVESKGYAGGLVGLAQGSITKCHVGGHTYNGSFVVPKGTVCGDTTLTEDYYLINIKGEKASGGLAAESQNAPTGCYTTCSVGYYSGGKADTFIAICGSKSGSEKAYAIGSLIGVDNHKVIEQGTTWNDLYQSLSTLLEAQDANVGTSQVHKKYDASLSEPYPYYVSSNTDFKVDGNPCHLGDWSRPQSAVNGWGLFYWEKENGKVNIKAGYLDEDGTFKDDISTLCTEMDGVGITEYGYGYFYSRDITNVDVSGFVGQSVNNGEEIYKLIGKGLKEAGLTGVKYEVRLTYQNNNDHGDKEFTLKGTANGNSIEQRLYYNPDFCAISDSTPTQYEIRSIKQLKYLSESNSYWDRKFELTHDVDFYITPQYSGAYTEKITPIGTSSAPFTGNFDGHCYRLINANLNANNNNSVGIFGAIQNATINGVVVFNGNYTIDNLQNNAAVGGIVGRAEGTSTITNCAFTGKIYASSQGSIAAGGIVGIAGNGENTVTVSNCQAVLSNDMTVTANNDTVTAGGIVGTINSNIPISNCYSGGNITATGSQTYVGGIFGGNSFTDGSVQNCYTYYVPNNPDAHPIGKKSDVAYVNYYNCYYLNNEIYNASEIGEITGITKCDGISDLDDKTQALLPLGGFSSDAIAYLDLLDTPFSYAYPAVISEGGQFYHYGPSPFGETPVTLGENRFGVFYWEQEGSEYHLKVCHYDKIGGNYQYKDSDNLCKHVDGNRITQSGYGYFIGKGIKDGSAQGFTDSTIDEAMLSTDIDITSALAECLKESGDDTITADKVAKNFTIKCYDYTNSRDVESRKVSIKLEDSAAEYDFNIVPGLCAISNISTLDYEIRTAQHLKNLSAVTYKNKTFKQTHDIIFTDGNTVTPIGDITSPFKGTYDGGRYRIHNLKVQSSSDNVGLFGYTNGATIKDTFVIEGNVSYTGDGNANIGGLVGNADSTKIENSIYTGAINARAAADKPANIGGIVGSLSGSSNLKKCEATADITVSGKADVSVGGIAGTVNSNIVNCYSGGSLTWVNEPKSAAVGGIVGKGNSAISVDNCYTHMHIPGAIDNVTVHPIGNDVSATGCHYIESKNHYANAFDTTGQSGITKHFEFNEITTSVLSGFSNVDNTYPTGLTANNANPYPLPAVVRDGLNYVHYGKWNHEVETLSPGTYGVFYWEEETDKDDKSKKEYHVRVWYVKEDKLQYKDTLCNEMDGNIITDYGYGYFYDRAIPLDDYGIDYTTDGLMTDSLKSGIRGAIENLDFSNFDLQCSHGNRRIHNDTQAAALSYAGKPLTVTTSSGETSNVYVKYNPDFCYMKVWTGSADSEPSTKYEPNYKYEIRSNQHLSTLGLAGGNFGGEGITHASHYLESDYIQTHDIYPNDEYGTPFNPIGTKENPFKGTYNGNGYRLINASYTSARDKDHNVNFIGLFGVTDSATIENVTMFNAKISVGSLDINDIGGKENIGAVGGIVAYANNTIIKNSAFYGSIDAGIITGIFDWILPRHRFALGGIVGFGNGSMDISNCESVVDLTWFDDGMSASYHVGEGGIAGISYGKIANCYSGGLFRVYKDEDNDGLGGVGEIGKVRVTAGGIVGSGIVTVSNSYSYTSIADYIKMKNPIGNDFEHTYGLWDVVDNYKVTKTNCYYLKGENFYNYAVNDPNIKAYDKISDLAAALKTIFPDSTTPRYNVEAYTTDLDNPGIYPLPAVITVQNECVKTKKYVHYGDVSGMIQYRAIVNTTTGTGRGTVSPTTLQAAPGDNVKFTVTPEPNSTIKSVTVKDKDGKDVTCTKVNDNTYSFKMQKGGVTVIVNFKSNFNAIKAKVNDFNGGTLDCGDKPEAAKGTEVKFTVNPKEGWKCTEVTVKKPDGASVNVTYTKDDKTEGSFTMPDDDVTVTANFEKILYNITPYTSDKGNVKVYKQKAGADDEVKFYVEPIQGWKCTSVTAGGATVTFTPGDLYGSFIMPDYNVTISATFEEKPTGPIENKCKINVEIQGSGTVDCPKWCDKNTSVGGIKVVPEQNWRIESIMLNNDPNSIWLDNGTYRFQSPNADEVKIVVKFAPLPKIFAHCDHGTVQIDNNIIPADGMCVKPNQYTGFVINSDSGWWCSHIKIVSKKDLNVVYYDKANTNMYYAGDGFTMPNEDVTIIAEFSPR